MSLTKTKPNAPRPAVPLCFYQQRWIRDHSRFKIAVKARRIGFTFAATLEIALDAVSRRTRWLIISRTQETAKEALREVANHLRAMKIASSASSASYEPQELATNLFWEGMKISKFTLALPNGSEITAMTAHPDAARGFGGNVLLDEHGFHRDSEELWKGAAAAVLRGHRLIVISTPHYQTGNFYRLAREAGLVSGRPPLTEPRATASGQSAAGDTEGPLTGVRGSAKSIWSPHWVDIHTAAPQLASIGVPIDLHELRELAGDEEAWNQEFCCQFLSAAEMWIPLELIAAARSPVATLDWEVTKSQIPSSNLEFGSLGIGNYYVGADIGRKRDRTAIWIDERIADVAICRGLILLDRTPFERQYEVFCDLLSLVTRHSSLPLIRRACIDQTGMGMALVERLQEKFGSRVEGVTFTGPLKEDMSIRVRRRLEQRLDKIPESAPPGREADLRNIEHDLAAIKRQVTSSGALRFDAERTDAGHADIFWAKALADLAADSGVAAVCLSSDESADFADDSNTERELAGSHDKSEALSWARSGRELEVAQSLRSSNSAARRIEPPHPSIWSADRVLANKEWFQ